MQPSRLIVFAPRSRRINLYARIDGSSVPDGTIPGKTIPEAPRIPDPSIPNGIRSWNVVSNFANIGYRPIILTLKNQLPSNDGDFITILSTGPISNLDSKTVLVRTLSMSKIINSTDWIPNTNPDHAVFQEGPNLPDRKVCIVQASGGHDSPVYYVGDLSTTLSNAVFLSGPKQERLWKWKNGMSDWNLLVPVTSGLIGPSKAKRFFVDPYRPSRLYVLDINHIYRSDNGGQTWVIDILMEQALTENGKFPFVIDNNANPEDALIRDMIFDPFDPNLRFAAGPAGVFYTSNGVNWESLIRTAANPMHITSLTYDFVSNPNNRNLYVSTSNRGLLRLKPQKHLLNTQGKINFLRVHDVGTGWGPPSDFINVECVIKFKNAPTKAYGFQLRNDTNSKAHQDMLDLLRDAFNHDWVVSIDYEIEDLKKNGVIRRIMSIGK
jgi:hypothetical protein